MKIAIQFCSLKVLFLFLLTVCLSVPLFSSAQKDTLFLSTGEIIIGNLKEMKRNVSTMGTDFSENDLQIKWSNIKRLTTFNEYLITLMNGNRFVASIKSLDGNQIALVNNRDTLYRSVIKEVVHLRQIEKDFKSRLDLSFSLGYNFTKANNLSQYSVRSNAGYKARKWLVSARFNQIIAQQNDAERTQRLDANAVYNRYLKKNWFTLGEVNLLTSTAQNIQLRTVVKVGLGRYLVQTNNRYWTVQTGISYNNESFNTVQGNSSNQSTEAFVGTEVNLYDIGDFHLLSKIVLYPGITESGRWRSDLNIDIKYDLPLDFYVNLGFSLNYDNQPFLTGVETDYIFQTTFGWSL